MVVAVLAEYHPLARRGAEIVRGLGLHAVELRDGADGARGHDVLEVRHPPGADGLRRDGLEHRPLVRAGRAGVVEVIRPRMHVLLRIRPGCQARAVEEVRQAVVRLPRAVGVVDVQVLLAVQHELVAGQEKRQQAEHEDVVFAPLGTVLVEPAVVADGLERLQVVLLGEGIDDVLLRAFVVVRESNRHRLGAAGRLDLAPQLGVVLAQRDLVPASPLDAVAKRTSARRRPIFVNPCIDVPAASLERHGRVAAECGVVAAQRVGQLLEARKRLRARRRVAARARQTEDDRHERDDDDRHDQQLDERESSALLHGDLF